MTNALLDIQTNNAVQHPITPIEREKMVARNEEVVNTSIVSLSQVYLK